MKNGTKRKAKHRTGHRKTKHVTVKTEQSEKQEKKATTLGETWNTEVWQSWDKTHWPVV